VLCNEIKRGSTLILLENYFVFGLGAILGGLFPLPLPDLFPVFAGVFFSGGFVFAIIFFIS
jgi:hypothetical protein